MNLWRLITHHWNPQQALQIYTQNNFIALGWGLIGDLSVLRLLDASAIAKCIGSNPNYMSLNNSGQGGRCLWAFGNEMEVGDLVILSKGKGPLPNVVEVTGGYYWDNRHPLFPSDDYFHCRRVIQRPDLDGRNLWTRPAAGWSLRWALVRL